MRLGDLSSLPPTLSTEQAAEVFGIGVDHLWSLARKGDAPVEPLRLGARLRWPTFLVLRSVGLEVDPSEADGRAQVVPIRAEPR